MSMLVFLSLILSSSAIRGQVCHISTPIAVWMKNNNGPCGVVIGNFILDGKADAYVDQLYKAFTNLTRIEGCLSVKGFTGKRNLHFLSNLEEVKSTKTKAELHNVIHVEGPNLDEMGFNSLVTVDGPGEIVLKYESETNNYRKTDYRNDYDGEDQSGTWKQTKCFTREEVVFLAYHPQFKGEMYQPCETDDPCLRPDIFYKQMRFENIPRNCTVYVGAINIYGLYLAEDEAITKFASIKLIIGELRIAGTLFNSLERVFPNLEMVYPTIPRISFADSSCQMSLACNPLNSEMVSLCLQQLNVGLNRFLKNISLPRLLPIRPIDVSVPIGENQFTWSFEMGIIGIDLAAYLPDTIQDYCSFFPQFKEEDCGVFSDLGGQYTLETSVVEIFAYEIWVTAMICVAIGLVFSLRAMIVLQFSPASKCLPHSRNYIMVVIFITTLVALESCIMYQKSFQTNDNLQDKDSSIYMHTHFSEFQSIHLTSPLFQHLMLFLAWSKHACLTLVIFCYADIIIYYRFWSHRVSKYFSLLCVILAIFLCVYLQSQLAVTIRGRTPHYHFDQQVIFMPFVMSADYLNNFTSFVPQTRLLPYKMGVLTFATDTFRYMEDDIKFNGIPFEIHGKVLPEYTTICDILMAFFFFLFHTLKQFNLIGSYDNYNFLLLLYLQLSMNRIRFFINDEIMRGYCKRFDSYCYVPLWKESDNNEEWMSKESWETVERVVEKLPYLFYPIASLSCYNFARYHHYLGAVLNYRVTMDEAGSGPTRTSHASEIPDVSVR